MMQETTGNRLAFIFANGILNLLNNGINLLILFVFLIVMISCSTREKYAGTYRTDDATDQIVSELELKNDGEGVWRVNVYEEPITWFHKKNEIRLNTKKGAVLVANIIDDTLIIHMSGGKKLLLKKVK